MNIRWIVLGVSLFQLSCTGDKLEDANLRQLYPTLTLTTESVDFEVVVLYDDSQEFQIINSGLAELEISEIRIDGNDDEIYSIDPTTTIIEPNQSQTVTVHFEPATYREYNRQIVLESNDPENATVTVPLNGEGIDGPVPDIEVTPRAVDFGLVAQGASSTQYFTLTNRGTGDLIIESVTIEGSENFQLMTDVSGVSYGLEQSSTLVASYSPTAETGDNAIITITSNDPDESIQTVTLLGNGGGEYEYPVAKFPCPEEVDPPTTEHLNAQNSFDPQGYEPLTYLWSLTQQPEGSQTTIEEPTLDYTPLFVDIAGDYQVQLVVENSIGLPSEPKICDFTAIPDEAIQIELVWDKANTDVDLHMVMEGYDFYSYDGDCCWCNPNPEWGNSGVADDPQLSLDNRIGYGPEEIEIDSPYDGSYNIMVHYFNGNGNGDTLATVKVYLDGLIIAEESRLLSPRDLWDVGYIYWLGGAGQFVVENDSPSSTTITMCE
jgi:hypothetical protein